MSLACSFTRSPSALRNSSTAAASLRSCASRKPCRSSSGHFTAIGDELDRLAETLFERGVQLLVHRRAHLLQLLRVVGAQQFEALFDRRAHRLEPLLVTLRQRRQAIVLQACAAGELVLQGLREM